MSKLEKKWMWEEHRTWGKLQQQQQQQQQQKWNIFGYLKKENQIRTMTVVFGTLSGN